ncbi:hypothetical protein, partial [Hominenteromicrobium sp.]|uniref:hypothetical protein n=2 Tax=Hominenteromicrobium sp. TaxID=3073581 RepID=UPI003AEFC1EC
KFTYDSVFMVSPFLALVQDQRHRLFSDFQFCLNLRIQSAMRNCHPLSFTFYSQFSVFSLYGIEKE